MRRFIVIAIALFTLGSMNYAEQQLSSHPNYTLNDDSKPIILSNINEKECNNWVDSIMNGLTLREKIGQLFIYTIAPEESRRNVGLLHDAVSTYKVGGLLFSGGQMQTQAALTNRAQEQAKVPLLITFDGEWGLSMRLKNTPTFPRNMVLGCIVNDSLIYEYGREVARQCKEMGVQVNFAPVADINVNPNNPVINSRSFGEEKELVAQKVIAYGRGLESENIMSVSKHFPGHGDTDIDSHYALPVLPFTRERLDSIELYPFGEAIDAGLSGMMVGHLYVPSLEPAQNKPSSLSRNIVTNLLTDEMGFKGLIFTDALAMKGVFGNKNVCLQAIKAGNDMVLSPPNLKNEIEAIVSAVNKGEISLAEIERKCRKVLTYKYALGLTRKPHIRVSGLDTRINTPEASELVKQLNLAAITVLSNDDDVLPMPSDVENSSIALLEIPGKTSLSILKEGIANYTPFRTFQLPSELTTAARKELRDSLANYSRILIAISEPKINGYQSFFNELANDESLKSIIYLCFAPVKTLTQMEYAVDNAQSVILAHSPIDYVQTQVADILFGEATANGRLSASVGNAFGVGEGVTVSPETEVYYEPEDLGVSTLELQQVDSIAESGISQGAYPGCQIVILKDGKNIYQKSYGTFEGVGSADVKDTDVYDLASVSKTCGTLIAVMKLYDGGYFNLSDKLSDHLPWLKNTNKSNITIRELLLHQSGLPPSIIFYQELIDKNSYKGPLYFNKRSNKYSVQVDDKTWANPNYKYVKGMTSETKTDEHTLKVCDNLWINKSFVDQMKQMIIDAPMKNKQYRYSDVGFILLHYLVEAKANMPMEEFLQKEFYGPMGLEKMGYNPLNRIAKEEIVPSTKDYFVRKGLIQGYVHDESAAFQGGIAGSAGLFGNAEEVASIYQMILDKGMFKGKRYLSEETCRMFTTETSKVSRRGLGFDRPEPDPNKVGPCSPSTPNSVFGHTGFTGTCVWADPENDLVFVFLSNRIYPTRLNRKLMQLNIRPELQEAIYNAIIKK